MLTSVRKLTMQLEKEVFYFLYKLNKYTVSYMSPMQSFLFIVRISCKRKTKDISLNSFAQSVISKNMKQFLIYLFEVKGTETFKRKRLSNYWSSDRCPSTHACCVKRDEQKKRRQCICPLLDFYNKKSMRKWIHKLLAYVYLVVSMP